MAQQWKMTVPLPIIIKEEVISDNEVEIQCRLCHKSFASAVALNNHARMDHIDAYESGDHTIWTKPADEPVVKTNTVVPRYMVNDPKSVQKKKQKIISSMVPTKLTTLASNNVSYIIIKSGSELEARVNQAAKKGKETKTPKKVATPKKSREPQVITGPFECLEPSPLGADGTCHQIFFSCCQYSEHARTEHSRRRRSPRCQVCERVLPAKDNTAPHICESCGEGFQTPEDLQDHMNKLHVKEKPYECSVCHKRFTQQGGVLQHMRRHTGDRPFPCTWCDKAFTQKSGLDQHLRTHTKQKPYRCVVCSKTFIQSVHLKQHMRTHTNVSPFQCGICHKKFKQSSHLNFHLKNHSPKMTRDQKQNYGTDTRKTEGESERVDNQEMEGETQEQEEQEETQEEVQEEEEMQEEDEVDEREYQIEIQEMSDVEQVIAEPSILEDGDTYIIGGSYEEMQQHFES